MQAMHDTRTHQTVKKDLTLLGILVGCIIAIIVVLKIDDSKSGFVEKLGTQVYNKILSK